MSAIMPSSSNLRKLQQYLGRYQHTSTPAAFEYLVATAFSRIFHLPLQTKAKEDPTIHHRVIWKGDFNKKNRTFSKSPSGADSICFAFEFYILVESTLRSGANQWRKEFVECLRHYDDFVRDNRIAKNDVYLAMITPKLHKDTYTGFKQKVVEGYNVILLEAPSLARIWEVSNIVLTMRHLDLRQLFLCLVDVIRDSSTFEKMRDEITRRISEWREGVFKREKTAFFGLRSYEAMKRVGRRTVGTSEILLNLHEDRKLKEYMSILGGGEMATYIREGLLSERLAYCIRTPDEDMFCMVNKTDFKSRGMRLINAVEKIDG